MGECNLNLMEHSIYPLRIYSTNLLVFSETVDTIEILIQAHGRFVMVYRWSKR